MSSPGFGRGWRGWLGWRWWALVGAPPPLTPEKTALHTKSAQTAGLEAIWCEVPRKILRNTPV
ncbi:hypothetical protein [Corynebacterium diphtheriae]|uniref:hypothetical protein n=1 Tax=Corynebacterium diphtheriae TaxID=1717 RepID=UPI0035309D87